ncbi:hypothetical protein AB9G23_09460 [Francisella philomiragia]|uniref:hypothetical protein n=1 Tax=Francisella philomiragia TaxID=28110 RepID=UPI003511BD5F
MINESIGDILNKTVLFGSLNIDQFQKVTQHLISFFHSKKNYYSFSQEEKYIFNRFHNLVVMMLEDNANISINGIHAYNELISDYGEFILEDLIIQKWLKLYTTYKFFFFLKKIDFSYIKESSQDNLLNVLQVITSFIKQKQIIFNDDILHLFKSKLNLIFTRIDSDVSYDVYQSYKDLNHHLIKDNIDFDFYVTTQEISVEINPISENLEFLSVKFDNYQQIGNNFHGVLFTKKNVQNLNIDAHSYGFDGDLELNLVIDSENLHPDYLFLFHGMPMSVLIIVKQIYKFKQLENTSESFAEELVYHGLTIDQNHSTTFTPRRHRNNQVRINLKFCDPLKALLSQSHPMKVAKNISYTDLIEKLINPFKELIEIDNQATSSLKQKKSQIFIFCSQDSRRSLYDFFIETLDFYQINLQCKYTKKVETSMDENQPKVHKKTCYLLSTVNTLIEGNQRINELPEVSERSNIWNLDQINIIRSHSIVPTCKAFNVNGSDYPVIAVNEQHPAEQKEDTDVILPQAINLCENILFSETIFNESDINRYQKYDYALQQKWKEKNNYTILASVTWQQLPLTSVSYPNLQLITIPRLLKYSIGQFCQKVSLVNYHLSIKQTKYTENWIINSLKRISENQEASKEKTKLYLQRLSHLKHFPRVSHIINVKQNYKNDSSIYVLLPKYRKFVGHTLHTSVFSSKEVDPKKQNEYSLVRSRDNSETGYNKKYTENQQQVDVLTMNPYSEDNPHIKLKIPKSILFEGDQEEDCFIYLPADQGQPFSNQYLPYAQGDILEVTVTNQEKVVLNKLISNRFLIDKKASEEFIQQTSYGLTDEMSLRYLDNYEDAQFELKQNHNDSKGFKQLIFSQKQGLTLKFTTRQDKDN